MLALASGQAGTTVADSQLLQSAGMSHRYRSGCPLFGCLAGGQHIPLRVHTLWMRKMRSEMGLGEDNIAYLMLLMPRRERYNAA